MTNIVSVCFLDVSARVRYSTTLIPTEKAGNVGIQRKDSAVGKKLPNGEDNKSKRGNKNIICSENQERNTTRGSRQPRILEGIHNRPNHDTEQEQ